MFNSFFAREQREVLSMELQLFKVKKDEILLFSTLRRMNINVIIGNWKFDFREFFCKTKYWKQRDGLIKKGRSI